jgi:hypothetical protein
LLRKETSYDAETDQSSFQEDWLSPRHLPLAERVYSTHAQNKGFLIFVKLAQHILSRNELRIVISDTLQASDMDNRANCRTAKFAYTLSDVICDGKDLISVIVDQKMITGVWTAHVPMKVFCFEVKAEYISQQGVEDSGKPARYCPRFG